MRARDYSDPFDGMDDLDRRLRDLETSSPLENASVRNGRVRFIGGTLRVDSGGRVEIVGTLAIEGNTNLTGPTTVTGTFTVQGPWSLDGDGNITGDVSVTGDITVTGSGRIRVGNMILDPSSNGGSVKFFGGPEVYASGAELSLYSGVGAFITLNGSSGKLNGPGAKWLEVTATAIRAVGLPTIPRASANNAVIGTVWADTSGNLFRVI